MLLVVRAMFPGIIVLRLADSNKPNMDKLYFYVRRLDKCLNDSQELLNAISDHYGEGKQLSYKKCINLANGQVDSDDDDEGKTLDDLEIPISDSDNDMDDDETSLGLQFISCWKKRREKLVHPYSVSGWMLSPIAQVYNDSKKNYTGNDRQTMETLFIKLFTHETTGTDAKVMSDMLDKFWAEYECFLSKNAPYNRDHIWLSSDLQEGCSYMWHKKNSLRFTDYLGRFACIVCSKILGIGAAERNWGDVKHLKTDKRSHISSDRVKKQATIFGASCADRARAERDALKSNEEGQEDSQFSFWDDKDFDNELGFDMDNFKDEKKNPPKRVLKCYVEDWEKEGLHQQNPVMEAQFLRKYGGLQFIDCDDEEKKMIYIDDKFAEYKGARHGNHGWCLIGFTDEWVEDDPDNEKYLSPWTIFPDCPLHTLLAEYYKNQPDLGVMIEELPQQQVVASLQNEQGNVARMSGRKDKEKK